MTIKVCPPLRLKFKCWPNYHFAKQYSIFSSNWELISSFKSCNETLRITQIHGSMVKTSLDLRPFTLSKLLAYASMVDIQYAASIFKHIEKPNIFMFNTMLRGYSISDNLEQAFLLFNYMRTKDILLDQFTFVSTLKSCARAFAFCRGIGIHSVVFKSGFDLFINVRNTLLHFYSVCGRIGDAHKLFDEYHEKWDLVSWNILMGGYLHLSQPYLVINLFKQLCKNGFSVGVATMLTVLSAAGDIGDYLAGASLHVYFIKNGFCLDLKVITALISMYGKTGHIVLGHRVFDEAVVRDIVLWNCLIDGYAKCGLLEESLGLLRLMKLEQVKPNSSTLAGLLASCAASSALATGQCIHEYVVEQQIVLDAVLGTALVNMYAKCGLLEKAIDVFDKIENKDVKTWTTMIVGYGVHGQAKSANLLFSRMENEGYRPNDVTFLAVLSACSHQGLVTAGVRCFRKMVGEYGLTPKVEHYGCIIDLLGRAGLLEEAYKIIKSLPIVGDATAWRSLLAACRVYGNVDLGKCVMEALEEICNKHPTDAILLSGAHVIAGSMPEDIGASEESMIKESACGLTGMKEAGCSSIEFNNEDWEQAWRLRS